MIILLDRDWFSAKAVIKAGCPGQLKIELK